MNAPKTRNENIVVQEMEKELLIYDLQTNKALCLNETSAVIYHLCDGNKNVTEINQQLNQYLKQQVSEDLIWLALDNFKKENLLEENESFNINFRELNRRQVIKKVGLASLVALPIVSSIIAPSSAMAASTGALLGQACGSGCASGLFCRNINLIGGGLTCCTTPGAPFTQTFYPGTFVCGSDCPSTTSAVCCSGGGSQIAPNSFCTMNGLVTCTCNPYP